MASNSLAPPSAVNTKHPDNPFSPIDGSGTLASPLTPSAGAPPPSTTLTDAQIHARREQQKRLMGKIWKEVENVMAEMRTRLEDGLRGTSGADDGAGIGVDNAMGSGRLELGIDEVEKSIERVRLQEAIVLLLIDGGRILLELNPREDPVWLYLDSQHRYILAKMKAVYQKRVKQLECEPVQSSFVFESSHVRANQWSDWMKPPN